MWDDHEVKPGNHETTTAEDAEGNRGFFVVLVNPRGVRGEKLLDSPWPPRPLRFSFRRQLRQSASGLVQRLRLLAEGETYLLRAIFRIAIET